MRVNDVGTVTAELRDEAPVGRPVRPRAHRADEFRKDRQTAGTLRERLQRTFRAFGRPGDEIDLETRLGPQAQHGCDGVLLRAPDDQPGDDMGDAHRGAAPTGRL